MFLEHVNLTVSDIERSIAFYRQLLEFEVRWRGFTSSGQPAAHVGNETIYLALFEAVSPGSVKPDYDRVGLNHFGFAVKNVAEIRDRTEQLSVTPHLDRVDEHGERLYVFDPDGIEIEIVQPV